MSALTTAAGQTAAVRLFNRELSELAFIRRVLEESENAENPALERLRFLAITGMLLDEFYRMRVTGLREQIRLSPKKRSPDGLDARAQLAAADRASNDLQARQDEAWQRLFLDLGAAGIAILARAELERDEAAWLRAYFEREIAPRLEPQVIDPDLPFPFIKDGEIVLAVELDGGAGPPSRALVPLPRGVPRFLALPGARARFIVVETVLAAFLDEIFAGYGIVAYGLARVVREGDLKLANDVDDLLELVRAAIERRERADVIRLEVDSAMPDSLGGYLAEALGLITHEERRRLLAAGEPVTASEFVDADRLLGLADTMQLVEALAQQRAGAGASTEPAAPVAPAAAGAAPGRPVPSAAHAPGAQRTRNATRVRGAARVSHGSEFLAQFRGDVFKAIAAQDRLFHFPYDDFGFVLEFLRQAAEDPAVVSIQQTLYRTGVESPVVAALARAARLGRKVTAVVELEAREDERENIELADRLKQAGARVCYGFQDLKVHVKALAVVRREQRCLRGYVNFATGNYHPKAARAYTDLSLFSAAPDLVADARDLFAYLTAGTPPNGLRRITLAPAGLRGKLAELIEREIAHARAGRPAAIWIKINRLSDPMLIEALYRASEAGVDIRIVVRGVCCLRPEVAGLSQRIRVKSVVGRFLEHSRILCFGDGGPLPGDAADVYLSSADWMPHKLDRRVEALVPIDDAAAKGHVQQVMAAYWRDEAQSWRLRADGSWVRARPAGFNAQTALLER